MFISLVIISFKNRHTVTLTHVLTPLIKALGEKELLG